MIMEEIRCQFENIRKLKVIRYLNIYQTALFLAELLLKQRLTLNIFYSYTDVTISG